MAHTRVPGIIRARCPTYIRYDQITFTGESATYTPKEPFENVISARVRSIRHPQRVRNIITGVNDTIDFNESDVGGAGVVAAVLPAGTYDYDDINLLVVYAMEQVGNFTYTCIYDPIQDRFTIQEATQSLTFSLLWASGANVAASLGPTIGYAATDLGPANAFGSNTCTDLYPTEMWLVSNTLGAGQHWGSQSDSPIQRSIIAAYAIPDFAGGRNGVVDVKYGDCSGQLMEYEGKRTINSIDFRIVQNRTGSSVFYGGGDIGTLDVCAPVYIWLETECVRRGVEL